MPTSGPWTNARMPVIEELIRTIFQYGDYSPSGQRAADKLVRAGEPALDVFLRALRDPPESPLHPKDLDDTISGVFARFAERIPDALIDRLERGEMEEFSVLWALGSGKGERSIDVLIAGLKRQCAYSRWAAAKSLIRRKSKRALPALLEALNDRSSMVRGAIVFAMKSDKKYRRPEALPALRRIIANKSIQKHSPGILAAAREVVAMIEGESGLRIG